MPGVWGPYFSAMVPDAWLNEGGQSVAGAAIERLLSMHPAAPDARRRARARGPVAAGACSPSLAAQAADSLSGAVSLANGLHVVPEFLGNRAPLADPHARAVIAGLGMDNDLDSLVALYVAGICSIGYGLRQIIEAQAEAGAPIERVVISGGAGRLDLVRQLLADATGKPVLATQAEEPVLLGAAMLGGVAGGLFDDVRSAMASMSQISKTYEPDAGDIADTARSAVSRFQAVAERGERDPLDVPPSRATMLTPRHGMGAAMIADSIHVAWRWADERFMRCCWPECWVGGAWGGVGWGYTQPPPSRLISSCPRPDSETPPLRHPTPRPTSCPAPHPRHNCRASSTTCRSGSGDSPRANLPKPPAGPAA